MSTAKKTATVSKFEALKKDREEYQFDRIANLDAARELAKKHFNVEASLTLSLAMLDLMDESVNDEGDFDIEDFENEIEKTKLILEERFPGAWNAADAIETMSALMVLPIEE